MDDVDLQPGQRVGEYVVEDKIGEGGFGTVFRAAHPVIGKLVAIKVLARQFSAQREMVSRFISEARAVNQIRHRNIIDIFSFGQLEDGRHYYVMEFLNGEPMDEFLGVRGRLGMDEAIPLLRALARALDAAHAKGIAHRDLKPENVFIAREEDGSIYPKLLDFGIAKLLGSETPHEHRTRTGAPMGTPAYMSPEQCRGRDVDHRTDIYAFGILTYELLTGGVPFEGQDYMEVLLKQIGEDPPPPSSRCGELPKTVDQGLLWMLAKDPAARPPNLVTAVRALEDAAVAAGISVPAGPAPTGVYATPTGQRMPAQVTPPQVTPLPGTSLSERPTAAIGTAQTLDARGLSEELDAVKARGSRKGLVAALGIVVAGAAGVIAYVVLSRGGAEPTARAPATIPAPVRPERSAGAAGAESKDAASLPAVVTIEVTGAPHGTEVFGPLGPVGVAPGKIQLPRGSDAIVLTFKAEGYKTATSEVTPSADGSLEVTLVARHVSKGKARGKSEGSHTGSGKEGSGRDAIEDPFKQ